MDFAQAVNSLPGEPIWYEMRRRADADPAFAAQAAEAAAPLLVDRCRVEQIRKVELLPTSVWIAARTRPDVVEAIRLAEARAIDEAKLLDAIAAEPKPDEPRLVYADWLLEQPTGEERARGERVHAEVLLARREDPALRARLGELWGAFGARWRDRASGGSSDRGIPLVRINVRDAADDLPTDPWLLGACLLEPTNEMWNHQRMSFSWPPALGRWIALDLTDLPSDDAGLVLRSPYLGRVSYLRVSSGAAKRLPPLPHLVTLEVV
jgi:uncharacterized protein (TIGR02996 family)